mmetsp:Transcript_41441/g.36813  ORF Transcript_41441/g.36813 Transcript_41441/m.36813 type:complete len:144 (-) Transcript_41441:610-1041(-)
MTRFQECVRIDDQYYSEFVKDQATVKHLAQVIKDEIDLVVENCAQNRRYFDLVKLQHIEIFLKVFCITKEKVEYIEPLNAATKEMVEPLLGDKIFTENELEQPFREYIYGLIMVYYQRLEKIQKQAKKIPDEDHAAKLGLLYR